MRDQWAAQDTAPQRERQCLRKKDRGREEEGRGKRTEQITGCKKRIFSFLGKYIILEEYLMYDIAANWLAPDICDM